MAAFKALDVTIRADVEAFVQFVKQTFGKLDVVVNNAGLMPLSPLEALKVDEWDRMIDVNIKGVLYGIAAGLPIMKRQGFGQFVNRCPLRLTDRCGLLRHETCGECPVRGLAQGERRHSSEHHLSWCHRI